MPGAILVLVGHFGVCPHGCGNAVAPQGAGGAVIDGDRQRRVGSEEEKSGYLRLQVIANFGIGMGHR